MGVGERGRRGGRGHRARHHHHHNHHRHHHHGVHRAHHPAHHRRRMFGTGLVFRRRARHAATGSSTNAAVTTGPPCGHQGPCHPVCILLLVVYFVCIFLGMTLANLGAWMTTGMGLAGIVLFAVGIIAMSSTCIFLCAKAKTNDDTPGVEAATVVTTSGPSTTTYYVAGESQVTGPPGAGVVYTSGPPGIVSVQGAPGQPILHPGVSYPTPQAGPAPYTMPPYPGQAPGVAFTTPYPPANYPENHPPVGYAPPSAPAHGVASGQEAFATPYPPATYPEHPPPSSHTATSAPTVVGNASSSVDIEAGNPPPPSYDDVVAGKVMYDGGDGGGDTDGADVTPTK